MRACHGTNVATDSHSCAACLKRQRSYGHMMDFCEELLSQKNRDFVKVDMIDHS